MKRLTLAMIATSLICLASCASGNLKSAKDYDVPPPPPIKHPSYNPYASYGEAHATWRPPVVDRDGTIQKPAEAASQWDRLNYEGSGWASGAARSVFSGPPGTF
jgi:hypothetical protein